MDSKSEVTRQKIFEVSLRLFVEKGYGSTTIRDIAKAADISTGLLFHYFTNKRSLLAAHLEFAAYGLGMVEELLESKWPPLEVYSSIARLTLSSLRDPMPRYLYLLVNQPFPQDAMSDSLRRKIDNNRIIDLSVPIIQEGQEAGVFKPGDPHALAIAFWGSIQGTAEILAKQTDAHIPDPDWLVDILTHK